MAKKELRQQINVYLLKESVADFDDALAKPGDWKNKETKMDLGEGADANLYLKAQTGKGTPKWMTFLEGGLAAGEKNPFTKFKTASAGALLLVRIEGKRIASVSKKLGLELPDADRWFALTYGYGRSFLRDTWEARFGFHIALNVAGQSGFRQVDFEQYKSQSIHRQVSASRLSTLSVLGFDSEQDLIRSIVAKLDKSIESFGYRITGKDNVTLSCDLAPSSIGDKCIELFVQASRLDYKDKFPDVESITPVDDENLQDQLDAIVIQNINDGKLDMIHFAPPDSISYDEEFRGFQYASYTGIDPEDEIRLQTLQSAIGNDIPVTMAILSGQKVQAVKDNGELHAGPWTVYRAMVAEASLNGTRYALMNGAWYAFDKVFVDDLDKYVNSLPKSSYLKSIPRIAGVGEDTYLMDLKPKKGIGFVVCHKENVIYGGGRSKVEFCDMWKVGTTEGQVLIHIKGGGGGQEFGHLANQAYVVGEMLVDEDDSFREEVIKQLQKQAAKNGVTLPATLRRNGTEYKIVFALFADDTGEIADHITLFGKVAFRRVARILARFQIEVFVERMIPKP